MMRSPVTCAVFAVLAILLAVSARFALITIIFPPVQGDGASPILVAILVAFALIFAILALLTGVNALVDGSDKVARSYTQLPPDQQAAVNRVAGRVAKSVVSDVAKGKRPEVVRTVAQAIKKEL